MATVGGQAVLEGVMMRGPGNWSVAVRTPHGTIEHVSRQIESGMARHRVLRLPVIRGVMAIGESLAIGFRALAISANYAAQEAREAEELGEPEPEAEKELSRGALIFAFAVAIGFAVMLFKVTPGLLTELLPIRNGQLLRGRRGLIRVTIFVALSLPALAAARPAPRLPVPRRRAQGDQRLRGGGGARAGDRAAVLAHPPALRDRVPALGDGDRGVRVRVLRPARPGTG